MSHLSIRLSDSERMLLTEQALKEGLKLSTYAKKRLFQNQNSQYNVHTILKITAEISTEINKFKTFEEPESIDAIEKGVAALWQILS